MPQHIEFGQPGPGDPLPYSNNSRWLAGSLGVGEAVTTIHPSGLESVRSLGLYGGLATTPGVELVEPPISGEQYDDVDIIPTNDVAAEVMEASPHDVYTRYHNLDTLEVEVSSRLTKEDYKHITPPDEWQILEDYAEAMQGKKVMFLNATAHGGGVAIMRGPLVHLLQELGVDAHWYALEPNEEASKVTKWKFHNVLQAVAEPGVQLEETDKEVYNSWIGRNADLLEEPLKQADVIMMDDWQPSGLIPLIKGSEISPGLNPDAPILFRDHIHTRGDLMGMPGTPQKITWDFLWRQNRIKETDVFAVHPKAEFVPPDVPEEKVVFMPATIDPLDDLNRQLKPEERQAGIGFINERLARNEAQTPIDLERPIIVLIARFDESKGMPQGVEAFVKNRNMMLDQGASKAELPQIIIIGNGAVDDPSGSMVLDEIMKLRSELPADIQEDIKVARIPHNDAAINALLSHAKVALQPSTAEGFESRVTDAIWQGVPVIGSDRGGIPLQIKEGESGFIINPYDTTQWAERMTQLITDDEMYSRMRKRTFELAKTFNYQFTTVPNAINWLYLAKTFLGPDSDKFQGNRKWVREMALAEAKQRRLDEQLAA